MSPLRQFWIDEFLESYDLWRDRCAGVRIAYARWLESEPSDRPLTYAAYRTALESEDQAARLHQRCAQRVSAPAAA